ncbi:hypothetical protein AYK24_06640 [Thermoplasmatales archaeon SG8-52-4]|nr:MAG: hypothetical protein AYK24_06640 [Thermoplasmatales archaeon SG8-52-4]
MRYVLQPRGIPPVLGIGSGRILRKADVKNKITRRTLKRFDNLSASIDKHNQKRKRETSVPKYYSSYTKAAFQHWNSLGRPFVQHRSGDSKVVQSGMMRLKQAVDRHGFQNVISSMDRCHHMLQQRWYIGRYYSRVPGLSKITLPQFFRLDKKTVEIQSTIPKIEKLKLRSFMTECLQGSHHLQKKFSYIRPDRNPNITGTLEMVWRRYTNWENIKITAKDQNCLISASERLIKFCDANHINRTDIIQRIDYFFNEYPKGFKPDDLSRYLSTDHFWKKTLPKELVRWGLYENLSDIKIID